MSENLACVVRGLLLSCRSITHANVTVKCTLVSFGTGKHMSGCMDVCLCKSSHCSGASSCVGTFWISWDGLCSVFQSDMTLAAINQQPWQCGWSLTPRPRSYLALSWASDWLLELFGRAYDPVRSLLITTAGSCWCFLPWVNTNPVHARRTCSCFRLDYAIWTNCVDHQRPSRLTMNMFIS